MITDSYTPLPIVDVVSPEDAVTRLTALQSLPAAPEYSVQMLQVDVLGNVLADLSQTLVKDTNSQLIYTSTDNNPPSLAVSTNALLQWGNDIVQIYQLIRNVSWNLTNGYPAETWHRFGLGAHVLTSPGYDDLDVTDYRTVSGYGKNYLLQTAPNDSHSFAVGTTYASAIKAIFVDLGIMDPPDFLSKYVDCPADWVAKTLAQPATYPLTQDSVSALDIVNELLKSSGCRPLYTNSLGRWVIDLVPKPAKQSIRWNWYGSGGPGVTDAMLNVKAVMRKGNGYSGDVFNVPNQWVFIQDGLTFQPIEGSGMYTVNNLTRPPADQNTVGRVIRETHVLQASGQADLKTQGDAIVTDALNQAETITLTTCPWPAAAHFDVFSFFHEALPISQTRKLQAQGWTLPLWGDPMTWTTSVVDYL